MGARSPDAILPAIAGVICLVLGGLFLWWWNPTSSGDGIIAGAVDLFSTLVAIARWVLLVGAVAWIVYNIVVWRTAEFAVTNLRAKRPGDLVNLEFDLLGKHVEKLLLSRSA